LAKRTYRIVHESYLAEWLAMNFPPGTWRTNVRLGKVIPPGRKKLLAPEERLLLYAFGASADAIVLLPDKVIIVEAMVRHEPGALEDLLKYKELFKMTEEFREHWHKPIELILLTPLDVPFYEKFAQKFGVKVVKYKPMWIIEYLHTYARRFWRGKLSSIKPP